MRRRTKRVKVGHSSCQLTNSPQFPIAPGGAPSIQPFPGDFPTEVWLEVHLCSSPALPCSNQCGRFWRRLNYGTYSRCTGHQRPYRNYSSGQCVSTFGRKPFDVFTISTYLASWDLRVGNWLYCSCTHLVKCGSI